MKRTQRILSCMLASLFAVALSRAESKVVLNDETVRVTAVKIDPLSEYKMEGAYPHGSVWVLIGGVGKITERTVSRSVHAGDSQFIPGGTAVSFRSMAKLGARLMIVAVKQRSQAPTVQRSELKLGGELQDTSDRNVTLIVPLSAVRLRDVRNLGNESEWKASKPEVLSIVPGKLYGSTLVFTIFEIYSVVLLVRNH